jgi:tRNA pseudouridine55 synthase
VTVHRLELLAVENDTVTVGIACSAGFYVRSLAHDLGSRLGCGACLETLRRTRSGEFGLDLAVALEMLVRAPEQASSRILPIERLLPGLPSVTLTGEGERRVAHGRVVEPAHFAGAPPAGCDWIRLLDRSGSLLALGRPAAPPGSLHPSVVLI